MRGAVVAALVVLAACGGGGGDEPVQQPSPLPTPLTSGRAEVRVTGNVRETFEVPLDREAVTIYRPPEGGFAITWSAEGRSLGIGGHLFTGTRPTGERLSVTVTALRDGVPVVLASLDGECRVTIERADRDGIEGTFECLGLSSQDLVAGATGTFSASA